MLDIFGINKFHEEVRERIGKGEPGWAQSEVNSVMVSYKLGGGFTAAHSIDASPRSGATISGVLEEMIVDVARDEGIASVQTFSLNRVKGMIDDLRKFPTSWKKKHKTADLLEAFYLNGAGAPLLFQ